MNHSASDSIVKYTTSSDQVKLLYRWAMDAGFWPDFPDYQIADLGSRLEVAGINDINTIDNLITENAIAIKQFIGDICSNRKNCWRLNSGFLCELVLILKYPSIFTKEYLVENRWDEEIAQIVLASATRSLSIAAQPGSQEGLRE